MLKELRAERLHIPLIEYIGLCERANFLLASQKILQRQTGHRIGLTKIVWIPLACGDDPDSPQLLFVQPPNFNYVGRIQFSPPAHIFQTTYLTAIAQPLFVRF
jgi:hypothetical protein